MNQENKRRSHQTGMDDKKQDAMKKLREARMGNKRLDQLTEVTISNNRILTSKAGKTKI